MELDIAVAVAVAEMARSVKKFPGWPVDPLHACAVLQEEIGELQKELVQAVYEPRKTSLQKIESEAAQVAAMALRFLMGLGSYTYVRCDQRKQSIETVKEEQ